MPIDGLFGTTVELLGKTLELRSKRHAIISGNIANAETPGYTPSDLSFESELKGAMEKRNSKSTSHSRHIPLKKGGSASLDQLQGTVVESSGGSATPDGNSVQMETEMSRMAENQIMYNASVQLLSKKFEMLKQAIKGTP